MFGVLPGIVGLNDDESATLLALLQSKLDDPNMQCRWRWRQYDVAVWDERCTNHRAMSDVKASLAELRYYCQNALHVDLTKLPRARGR